jgi:hypothetical protein
MGVDETLHLSQIQATEFWTHKEKERRIKEKGYWDAYKELKSRSSKLILT